MSITKDQIIEAVAAMSVMDITKLIKAMEEKFGVCATTTSNVVNDTAVINEKIESEEKAEFDVILKTIGANKIAIIKAVRSAIGLGLKEAKDLVESAPTLLKENISKIDAETLKKSLEELGAEVEVK